MAHTTETWRFGTAFIGQRVLVFDELTSSNTTAVELAAKSNCNGLVIIAKHQTSGRGQYGRVWQSRPGSSLLMSVVLDPPMELRRPAIITALAAVAVAEAIFELTGIQSRIKWPNDLLIRDKKVCGILSEQHGTNAIIGIGLNLNQTSDEFTAADLPDATSLAIQSGGSFELRSVAGAVIQQLDREYSRILRGERIATEANWKERIGLVGKAVMIESMDSSTISGRLLTMDFDRLELDTGGGAVHAIKPENIRHIIGM